MNIAEFEKELKRVGLAQKHADKAFKWIRKHGEQGVHDIFWYRTRPSKKKNPMAALDKEKNRYFMRETGILIYLWARKDKGELAEDPPFDEERKTNEVVEDMQWNNRGETLFKKLGIEVVQYSKSGEEVALPVNMDKKLSSNEMNILEQFNQIIFYGPPGTGKTYRAKEILKELFSEDSAGLKELQGGRWDIIQFHPSYNYEDFVRGIKVETAESGDKSHVVYKTVNRIFGKMCGIAKDNPDSKHVLIIDEINRANVSAVLGELIYALEYRDESVNTPYEVDDKQDITIPKNLYIISTMNSADRTIGQIDYAVRRRFAFVPCLPDESVIEDDKASEFFGDVDAIFTRHISQDYDKMTCESAIVIFGEWCRTCQQNDLPSYSHSTGIC